MLPFAVLVATIRSDETVKEVGGIVRASSSLGVVPHGEGGDIPQVRPLNHVVVQTHVGDPDLTELGVRCGHGRQSARPQRSRGSAR